jgi:hypothetical protein
MKKTLEQNDALKIAFAALKDLERDLGQKWTKKVRPLQYEAVKTIQQVLENSPTEGFTR